MELYDSSSVRVLLEQRDRERKKRNIIRYLSSRSFSSLLFLSRLYTRDVAPKIKISASSLVESWAIEFHYK